MSAYEMGEAFGRVFLQILIVGLGIWVGYKFIYKKEQEKEEDESTC